MASNLVPGTPKYGEVTAPFGLAESINQDPLAPVEDGRTAAKSAYTTTDSNGEPIDTTPPEQTTKGVQGTDTLK
jgi:hypothetical protein